jgi:hypothetical protein
VPAVLVWSGDAPNERASGWASCEKEKAPCSAQLAALPGVGHDGSVGLKFEAKGTEWLGFGWNWFSWWPDTAGTDIAEHRSLRFWIKITGPQGKTPEPFTVNVSLGGSARGGKDASAAVPIVDYEPKFADGEWHRVVVPIAPMLRGAGETFDTSRVWSLTIGAWNQGDREYSVQLDEIEFL